MKILKYIGVFLLLAFQQESHGQCYSWFFGLVNYPPVEKPTGSVTNYREKNEWKSHPYTIFDKRKPNWTLAGDIAQIRETIIHDTLASTRTVSELYKSLFHFAYHETMPSWQSADAQFTGKLANYAKANAFCYLIGLDDGVNDITGNSSIMNALKSNCMAAFDLMNTQEPYCLGGSDCHTLLFRSPELIAWCQAYDLMKTSGMLPSNDWEDEDGVCTPRNKLRLLAKNYYRSARGLSGVINDPWGWKGNHGLRSAAAIGMAAIVLNNAGVGFMRWNYKPRNWGDLANDGIYDNLFVGYSLYPVDDRPMTNSDGTAGFAEGEGYCAYSFSHLLPFFRAMNNFAPYNNSHNLLNTTAIQNIMKWYINSQLDDGRQFSQDNSHLERSSVFSLSGNPVLNPDISANNIPSVGDNGDLRADYIAIMNPPVKISYKEMDRNDNAG